MSRRFVSGSLAARAAKHDVSLNTKKLKFAQQTVKFGGYVVSENHSQRLFLPQGNQGS